MKYGFKKKYAFEGNDQTDLQYAPLLRGRNTQIFMKYFYIIADVFYKSDEIHHRKIKETADGMHKKFHPEYLSWAFIHINLQEINYFTTLKSDQIISIWLFPICFCAAGMTAPVINCFPFTVLYPE